MLACPHCNSALNIARRVAVCLNGHSYDQAREGYFNLLPTGRHAPTVTAGDTVDSLQARRRFLQAGHYQPIAAAVALALPESGHDAVVDAGCGEGYYLHQMGLNPGAAVGVDISRVAIRMAAAKYPEQQFVVGSSYRLPVLDQSLGAVVSIFAQRPVAEFQRVLRPDGVAITVSPGPLHLNELSALAEPTESAKRAARAAQRNEPPLPNTQAQRLTYSLDLDTASAADLVQMTPLYWQQAARSRLDSGLPSATVDVWITRTVAADLHPTPLQQ